MKPTSPLRRVCTALDAFAPHLLITCSLMTLTFYFINFVNDAMGFLTARISACFQLGYLALGLAVAVVCTILGRARISAIPSLALSTILLVPALISVVRNSSDLLAEPIYQHLLMVCAFLTFILAICDIATQRKAANTAYLAYQSEHQETKATKSEAPAASI